MATALSDTSLSDQMNYWCANKRASQYYTIASFPGFITFRQVNPGRSSSRYVGAVVYGVHADVKLRTACVKISQALLRLNATKPGNEANYTNPITRLTQFSKPVNVPSICTMVLPKSGF